MRTLESTAMPMVKTMPAMPGNVSVAPSRTIEAKIKQNVDREREIGEDAEDAVSRDHVDDDQGRPDVGRAFAGVDRVLAEAGTDGALLDHRELRRQRAGAQAGLRGSRPARA